MTHVFRIDPDHIQSDLLAQAASVIRAGGLVVFPTETVYGLGANALDAAAVDKIFAAKERPATDPLIVHIVEISQLEQVAIDIPEIAHTLAHKFWAGALTLVLKRHANVPPNVSAQMDTVAVRMPSHPIAQALIRAAGVPIAAPSANLFSRPSPTTAAHVLQDLDGRVDIILDGGATTLGLESTVLDLTGAVPKVLRPGGVTLEALRSVLSAVEYVPRYVESEAVTSPGMLLKHYSPRAEVMLFAGENALDQMQQQAQQLILAGRKIGILAVDEDPFEPAPNVEIFDLGSLADLETVGRQLFMGLRDLDQRGVEVILVRALPQTGIGLAIWDRLVRAAEGKIIQNEE